MRKRKRKNRTVIILFCLIILSSTIGMYFVGKSVVKKQQTIDKTKITDDNQDNSNVRILKDEHMNDDVIDEKPIQPVNKKEHNYIVQESERADSSYFDDAVFIGNSRTQGLMLYGGITNATFYADKGLMINKVFNKPITIIGQPQKDTVINQINRNKFGKYYIMLGTNELGWAYENIFIEEYQKLIDKIKEINPDAIIYIQSILPVSKVKSQNNKIHNNTRIENFNNLLKKLAQDNEVYYLDVAQQFKDETGSLKADASSDGIHLKASYCKEWTEYLLTHTVKSQNDEVIPVPKIIE